METLKIERIRGIKGEFTPPPDKSVTHRALILAAMADGLSLIHNPLISFDTETTMDVLRALGVAVLCEGDRLLKVLSGGYKTFKSSENLPLYCANSGTTARLIMGMLAPRGMYAVLDGDDSLRGRPMQRVITPLSKMGADLQSAGNICGGSMPVYIKPASMFPAGVKGDVPSAQVKSAVLLAGTQLDGITSYTERLKTRDHTEALMPLFGADININDLTVSVSGGYPLTAAALTVPGDISSAAFIIAAALIFDNSEITVRSVGINPTRSAFLEIIRKWGADIRIDNMKSGAEPTADITVRSSFLTGGVIEKDLTQKAIDELPLLGMLGMFTQNGVEIRNAEELRFKECDRIAAIVNNLRELGADAQDSGNTFTVTPYNKKNIKSDAGLRSFGDHRISMINVLLAKRFGLNILSGDINYINVSFPGFLEQLSGLEVT